MQCFYPSPAGGGRRTEGGPGGEVSRCFITCTSPPARFARGLPLQGRRKEVDRAEDKIGEESAVEGIPHACLFRGEARGARLQRLFRFLARLPLPGVQARPRLPRRLHRLL